MSEAASAGEARPSPRRDARGGRIALTLALTFAAGMTDAIGFLGFGGVFVSFISGDTTRLGLSLGQAHASPAVLFASTIALFVLGAAAAHAIAAPAGRWRDAAVLLLTTLLLVMAAAAGSRDWNAAALVLTAPAMGALSLASIHAQGVSMTPTFVTGTLVRLGVALADWALGRGGRPIPVLAGTWAAMLVGAAAGGWAYPQWALRTLAAPALLVAGLAVLVILATALRRAPRSEP